VNQEPAAPEDSAQLADFPGAEGGTRTPTALRPADFKSAASARSATSAVEWSAAQKRSA
jgi:hypothetical protein